MSSDRAGMQTETNAQRRQIEKQALLTRALPVF